MQVESSHAHVRRIDKLGVPTPLIVPSFSSRGFPSLANIWNQLSYKLFGVCLVSAFDVAEGLIPSNVSELVNVVFWDSGVFETNAGQKKISRDHAPSTCANWRKEQYRETLRTIGEGANAVVVNFDEIGSLEDQIRYALEDFSLVPYAASDFLVKPAVESEWVNLPKLGLHLDRLSGVNVIGITTRDAGDSLLTRCSSIVMLRDMLDGAGLHTPIHVFGAINPYEILSYFFSGADIFDGLDWLRCSFGARGSIEIGESAMEEFRWNMTDPELQMEAWTNNLRFLYQLQDGMLRYGACGGLELLVEEFPLARKAARIARIAGAEVNE